jgi:hypothetical protein
MLIFEAGPNGIPTHLLGVQANILEGNILGLGSIGMLTSRFRPNFCQFLTCALIPLEACQYSVLLFNTMTQCASADHSRHRRFGGLRDRWQFLPNLFLKLYMMYIVATVIVAINMLPRNGAL